MSRLITRPVWQATDEDDDSECQGPVVKLRLRWSRECQAIRLTCTHASGQKCRQSINVRTLGTSNPAKCLAFYEKEGVEVCVRKSDFHKHFTARNKIERRNFECLQEGGKPASLQKLCQAVVWQYGQVDRLAEAGMSTENADRIVDRQWEQRSSPVLGCNKIRQWVMEGKLDRHIY